MVVPELYHKWMLTFLVNVMLRLIENIFCSYIFFLFIYCSLPFSQISIDFFYTYVDFNLFVETDRKNPN